MIIVEQRTKYVRFMCSKLSERGSANTCALSVANCHMRETLVQCYTTYTDMMCKTLIEKRWKKKRSSSSISILVLCCGLGKQADDKKTENVLMRTMLQSNKIWIERLTDFCHISACRRVPIVIQFKREKWARVRSSFVSHWRSRAMQSND